MARISRRSRSFPGVERGPVVTVHVDGRPTAAYAGETVAPVLLASGKRVSRHTDKGHAPRGIFCRMRVCFDCLVTVDAVPNVRACVTTVRDGTVIDTGATLRE